ncbi:MAG: GFA family protein [Pseudomonadota bacterium]
MADLFEGRCHCGAVRFEVELEGGLSSPQRSNCSYSLMHGAVTLSGTESSFKLLKGFDFLRVYTFGSHTAKQFFCAKCGTHTHHEVRHDPRLVAVNVACLEGLSPFDFEVVPVIDGARLPDEVIPVEEPPQVGSITYVPDFGDGTGSL